MALSINAQNQSVIQGMLDLKTGGADILSCQVDASSGGGLIPGQAVKMVDSAGGIPKVVECALNSDDVFGFIVYDLKKATYAVGDKIEVMQGGVMYMTASAAIARDAKVGPVISGSKVVTATTGIMVIGDAVDKAAANGDLIRVKIRRTRTVA